MRHYSRAIVEENKFRALKTGLDGGMIDFALREEIPTRGLLLEALDFVEEVVDGLGTRAEMEFLRAWASRGDTGADRQIRAFETGRDLRDVVDFLVDETKRGL
jgi:carboxylate-amine ligase